MFGKPAPKEAQTITVQDGVIAEAWQLSITDWAALTDSERSDLRNRVVYAPNLATAAQ